jgi:hypothetical protein
MSSTRPMMIDYAPRPKWHRRWWRATVLAVVVSCIIAARRPMIEAWNRVTLLYWQRQCMNFSLPPDQVVYDEGPNAMALAAKGGEYLRCQFPPVRNNSPIVAPAAIFVPGCWEHFGAHLPFYSGGGAVLFLHEMISKSGVHRLVSIEHSPNDHAQVFVPGYDVNEQIFEPGTVAVAPKPVPMLFPYDVIEAFGNPPQALKIYAGQIDPADPSHFTIRYEMWGQTDVVDGRLDPTGNWIELKTRNPPKPPRDR